MTTTASNSLNSVDAEYIPINAWVLPHCVGDVVQHIIKHVLFMRQQIPLTFDEMRREIEENIQPSKTRRSAIQKRQFKWAKLTQSLFSDIDQILSPEYLPHIRMIALLLGPSVISPKEVYLVRIHSSSSILNSSSSQNDFEIQKVLKKIVRGMISSGSDTLSSPRSLTKFHVLTLMDLSNAPSKIDTAGFLPKKHLSLRIDKYASIVCIDIGGDQDIRANSPGAMLSECESTIKSTSRSKTIRNKTQNNTSSSNVVWFQSTHSIPGIPPMTNN